MAKEWGINLPIENDLHNEEMSTYKLTNQKISAFNLLNLLCQKA